MPQTVVNGARWKSQRCATMRLGSPTGDGKLYLAAKDGDDSAPDGAGFTVARTPSCGTVQSPNGDVEGFKLRFSSAGQPDVVVPMGETRTLVLGNQTLRVQNQRSYESHAPDDFWNWSYWFAP